MTEKNKPAPAKSAPAKQRAPRMSKVERLARELEAARAKEQAKIEAKLAAAREEQTKAQTAFAKAKERLERVNANIAYLEMTLGVAAPAAAAEPEPVKG